MRAARIGKKVLLSKTFSEGDWSVPYKSRLAGELYIQGYKEGYKPPAARTVSNEIRRVNPEDVVLANSTGHPFVA